MDELCQRTSVERQFSVDAVCEVFTDFNPEEIKKLRRAMDRGEVFNPKEMSVYIQYLDVNNLYGYAMSQPLPVGGFRWLTPNEITDMMKEHNKINSCTLEVDLEYPKELHDTHNDYPLAPERVSVNGTEKLIPNCNDKKNCVVHYRVLQTYLKYGLRLTKIHRGVTYIS